MKTMLKNVIVPIGLSVLMSFIIVELGSRYYYEWYYLKSTDTSDNPTILTIGDSFCASRISFPYILGDKLQGRYKIINAAEGGTGPDQYLMNMALNLNKKPDLCIVSFYLGNDIMGIRDFQSSPVTEELKLFLGRHLYAYHLVRMIWSNIRYYKSEEEVQEALDRGILNPHLIDTGRNQPDIVTRNLRVEDEDVVRAWDTLRSLIGQMKELSEYYEVPLYAVLIPDCVQVSDAYHDRYTKAGLILDVSTENMSKPQQLIRTILDEHQIDYLDLLPEFKKVNDKDIYLPNDMHMVPEGHLITADILLERLYERNLLQMD